MLSDHFQRGAKQSMCKQTRSTDFKTFCCWFESKKTHEPGGNCILICNSTTNLLLLPQDTAWGPIPQPGAIKFVTPLGHSNFLTKLTIKAKKKWKTTRHVSHSRFSVFIDPHLQSLSENSSNDSTSFLIHDLHVIFTDLI